VCARHDQVEAGEATACRPQFPVDGCFSHLGENLRQRVDAEQPERRPVIHLAHLLHMLCRWLRQACECTAQMRVRCARTPAR
jgi:hypothetical protein